METKKDNIHIISEKPAREGMAPEPIAVIIPHPSRHAVVYKLVEASADDVAQLFDEAAKVEKPGGAGGK